MNLAHRKVGVLKLQFFRTPPIGLIIQHQFDDLGACAGNHGNVVVIEDNMFVVGLEHGFSRMTEILSRLYLVHIGLFACVLGGITQPPGNRNSVAHRDILDVSPGPLARQVLVRGQSTDGQDLDDSALGDNASDSDGSHNAMSPH